MRKLTQQQQTVYDFIRQCMIDRGYGPTVREIGQHMDIKSPNGVMCHLRALEKKGMILRSAHKSRAIELVDPLPRVELLLKLQGTIAMGLVEDAVESPNSVNLTNKFNAADQFLLAVNDDQLQSMAIKAGDLLLVNKQIKPVPGQLVVAQFTESHDRFIGQLRIEAGKMRVSPMASQLIAQPTWTLNLLGTIVGVIRIFENSSDRSNLTGLAQ